MSVRIQPNHTAIGVPQWRHHDAHGEYGVTVPPMSGLTISDGTDYDIYLPDSVWLTVMEDLQEHFARKAAVQTISLSDGLHTCVCGAGAAIPSWHNSECPVAATAVKR